MVTVLVSFFFTFYVSKGGIGQVRLGQFDLSQVRQEKILVCQIKKLKKADKLHIILSNEAGLYKPTVLKVHPPFCRITAYATIPG